MSESAANKGVIISGNATIQSDNLAMGSGAVATKTINHAGNALGAKDLEEIRDKLRQLMEAVSSHPGPLDSREELKSSVQSVVQELGKEKPNKLTVTSLLGGIASAVKSVTGIATAAEALKAVVIRLL
jgi:hypothetical protein